MSKPHLDLLALAARLLKGFRVGKRADAITHLLIDIAGDLAHGRRRAPRLQRADRAVMFVGSVVDDVALIDVAGADKLCTARTNIDVTFLVEDEVGPAEGAIVARRLVPHRHMGADFAVPPAIWPPWPRHKRCRLQAAQAEDRSDARRAPPWSG